MDYLRTLSLNFYLNETNYICYQVYGAIHPPPEGSGFSLFLDKGLLMFWILWFIIATIGIFFSPAGTNFFLILGLSFIAALILRLLYLAIKLSSGGSSSYGKYDASSSPSIFAFCGGGVSCGGGGGGGGCGGG